LLIPGAALAGAAAMQTFKLATEGFGEAIGAGLTGDMEAFAEATGKMHPEMAAAARAAVAFKPQIDALKSSVQGAFWDDFADGVTALGDNLLPVVARGMTDVATQLGAMTDSAMRAASTPFFSGAVGSIFQSTAGFLREAHMAAGNLLTGLVGIGQIGATYLPALGESIGGVAARFSAWVRSIEGQNQIRAWIDQGIAAFSQLSQIVGNIGSTLGSVFTGLGGSIDDPLAKVVLFTQKLAELAASPGAQQALTALGVAAQAAGLLMGSVFLAALQAMFPIIIALSPLLTTIATTLASWAPVLGPLVVAAYAFSQAISLVTTVMGAYRAVMALSLATTIATVATTVGGWVAMAASAVASAAVMAASWLIAFAPAILVGALIVGLVALVVANWDTIKAATIAVWNAVSSFVVSAWNAIKSAAVAVWNGIVSAVTAAGSAIVSGVRSFVSGAVSAIAGLALLPVRVLGYFVQMVTGGRVQGEQLVNMVRQIPSRIMSIFSSAGSWLVNAGRSIIQGLWNGISSMINWVVGQVSAAMGRIRALFPFSPAKEGPFSGRGYTTYSGQALMQDFGKGITSATPAVTGATSNVLSGAHAALSAPTRTAAAAAGGGRVEITVAPGGDDKVASLINYLARTGKLNARMA
jgi:phage-related protein